jgi:hypothetical protein
LRTARISCADVADDRALSYKSPRSLAAAPVAKNGETAQLWGRMVSSTPWMDLSTSK